MTSNKSKGFTLVELLIVIAVIGTIVAAVVVTINPGEMLAQARDIQRMSDLRTLTGAIELYITQSPTAGKSLGSCAPGGRCTGSPASWDNPFGGALTACDTSAADNRSIDGNGWVDIDFTAIPTGSPLPILPTDPKDDDTYFYGYMCSNSDNLFELTARLESEKYRDIMMNDAGGNSACDSTYKNNTCFYETGNYLKFDLILPVFSPAAGDIASGTLVSISFPDSGASIYYTTDGSTPTTSSDLYAGPFAVTSFPFTLKAIAVNSGVVISSVGSTSYTQAGPAGLTIDPYQVKILSIKYFPIKDGIIDASVVLGPEVPAGTTLEEIRNRVTDIEDRTISNLENGSKYNKDISGLASMDYSIITNREYTTPMPTGTPMLYHDTYLNGDIYPIDYITLLNSENICNYVDTQGVREVWLWGYPGIGGAESNMSMGTVSSVYWNHGTYGDVSNSNQTNDLPQCSHTYTVYTYNYGRSYGEALEDHTHQLEWLLNWVDGNNKSSPNSLFWKRWVGSNASDNIINPGCGWTHYPPNRTTCNYDWDNPVPVLSDCSDWNPDGSGTKELVSCATWGSCSGSVRGDGCYRNSDSGEKFKVWWMQRLPGAGNTLTYNGGYLRNWWEFIADFDSSLAKGRSLISSSAAPSLR